MVPRGGRAVGALGRREGCGQSSAATTSASVARDGVRRAAAAAAAAGRPLVAADVLPVSTRIPRRPTRCAARTSAPGRRRPSRRRRAGSAAPRSRAQRRRRPAGRRPATACRGPSPAAVANSRPATRRAGVERQALGREPPRVAVHRQECRPAADRAGTRCRGSRRTGRRRASPMTTAATGVGRRLGLGAQRAAARRTRVGHRAPRARRAAASGMARGRVGGRRRGCRDDPARVGYARRARANRAASVARWTSEKFVTTRYGMPARVEARRARRSSPGSGSPLRMITPSASSTNPAVPCRAARSRSGGRAGRA